MIRQSAARRRSFLTRHHATQPHIGSGQRCGWLRRHAQRSLRRTASGLLLAGALGHAGRHPGQPDHPDGQASLVGDLYQRPLRGFEVAPNLLRELSAPRRELPQGSADPCPPRPPRRDPHPRDEGSIIRHCPYPALHRRSVPVSKRRRIGSFPSTAILITQSIVVCRRPNRRRIWLATCSGVAVGGNRPAAASSGSSATLFLQVGSRATFSVFATSPDLGDNRRAVLDHPVLGRLPAGSEMSSDADPVSVPSSVDDIAQDGLLAEGPGKPPAVQALDEDQAITVLPHEDRELSVPFRACFGRSPEPSRDRALLVVSQVHRCWRSRTLCSSSSDAALRSGHRWR